jgi:transposase
VQAEPEAWREIGQEVREQLDYRPAHYFRRRLVRKKFVRKDAPHRPPLIAPLPPSLQYGCLATPALIAHILVAKFCDHLPLCLQEQRLKWSHGIELPRQTMMRWLSLAVFWMRPIYQQLKTTVVDGDYVQVDETPIRYLDPGGGRCKRGYLWTTHAPGRGGYDHWEPSRASACLEAVLQRWRLWLRQTRHLKWSEAEPARSVTRVAIRWIALFALFLFREIESPN